jgi:hypothetical protein
VVEFDLVADSTAISFRYVFGSEEYPEYVGSSFNDVFGFFITGPNPLGGYYSELNIATLPQSTVPVAINNVNHLTNSQYYINNDSSLFIVFDGLTVALDAVAYVIPDSTYHVKIGVADAGDAVFDSGVFLSVQSMCADSFLTPTSEFTVEQSGKTGELNTVTVINQSKYARSFFWDFGDGFTSVEKNPAPHTYQDGGDYTISLTAYNYCCSDESSQSVVVEGGNSVVELLADAGYVVFPNPVQDALHIEVMNEQHSLVTITDMTGKQLERFELNSSTIIPMQHLAKGTYLLNIQSQLHSLTTRLQKQ